MTALGHEYAFYKTLLLGDVVRSVPAPEIQLAENGFEDSLHGNYAAPIERGASARHRVDIEPVFIKNHGGAESARAFFLRRLDFANALAEYGGVHATYPDSRLGRLTFCDQGLGLVTAAGVISPPAAHSPIGGVGVGDDYVTFTNEPSRVIAAGEKLLLIKDDTFEFVTVATQTGAAFTLSAPVTVAFAVGVKGYVVSWWLDEAAVVGSYKVGEGDGSPNAAKGAVLSFESAEDFEHAP